MDIILQFKRWKLFCLLVGIPVIVQFIDLAFMISRHDARAISNAILITVVLFIGVFFAWFFTLGTNLRTKWSHPINNKFDKI